MIIIIYIQIENRDRGTVFLLLTLFHHYKMIFIFFFQKWLMKIAIFIPFFCEFNNM